MYRKTVVIENVNIWAPKVVTMNLAQGCVRDNLVCVGSCYNVTTNGLRVYKVATILSQS